MSEILRNQLIKLGSTNPELRPHIRTVLQGLKTAAKAQVDVSAWKGPHNTAKKHQCSISFNHLEMDDKYGLSGFISLKPKTAFDPNDRDSLKLFNQLEEDLKKAMPKFKVSHFETDRGAEVFEFQSK